MDSPVKEIREKLGYTQQQMAREMGCSHTSERRFEYNGTLPRVDAVRARLEKLAKKAGVSIKVEAK